MKVGSGRKPRGMFILSLLMVLGIFAAHEAVAGNREPPCPGGERDRVQGPAMVGHLTLTDRDTRIPPEPWGTFYLDVEFISISASCNGERLIIIKDEDHDPLYTVKTSEVKDIKDKCVENDDVCLEGAVFYFNGVNPPPPDCNPQGFDEVIVSTVLSMGTDTENKKLNADVVLLWFKPGCEQ